MEKQLLITISDEQKVSFLLQLLAQLDFISVEEVSSQQHVSATTQHSILDSAGLWEGRDIDATTLRKQAWGGRGV